MDASCLLGHIPIVYRDVLHKCNIEGTVGKRFAAFAEAISIRNVFFCFFVFFWGGGFPCFALEIRESRRLDVRGTQEKPSFTNR